MELQAWWDEIKNMGHSDKKDQTWWPKLDTKNVLYQHAPPDEEYLGQLHPSHLHWIDDQRILSLFEKFLCRLEELEETINRRNKDICLMNRTGAGILPNELLLPSSGLGVTGYGIPNSICLI